LLILERVVWKSEAYARPAAIGAILGFVAGWCLRDALFVIGPDSDYPGPAYALLYLVTFTGALMVVAAFPAFKGSGLPRANHVPHNKELKLTKPS
jgi:hypothetical protein